VLWAEVEPEPELGPALAVAFSEQVFWEHQPGLGWGAPMGLGAEARDVAPSCKTFQGAVLQVFFA